MSLFNNNNENKKITWPEFEWNTGKKIKVAIENDEKTSKDDEKNATEQEINDKANKKNKKSTKNEEPEIKKVEKTVDEIIKVPEGSILRIDGEEFQSAIDIKPNQKVNSKFIHEKVIDPNGIINKWEYKNAALKYDSEDNIFYYVLESPKKG